MNGNTGGSGPQGRSPLRRLGIQAAAMAGIALLAVACGGGSSSGGHSTTYQKELAFSQCMRAHGVPSFPDPGSNGVIAIQAGGAGAKGKGGSTDQRLGGPQMTRANNACRHLLPNGGVPTAAQRQQLQNQALKFAECMRSHGVSNFPDPGAGQTKINIDPGAPQFQAAQRACRNLLGKGNGGLRIPA